MMCIVCGQYPALLYGFCRLEISGLLLEKLRLLATHPDPGKRLAGEKHREALAQDFWNKDRIRLLLEVI